jgi:DNA replication protein DnaC
MKYDVQKPVLDIASAINAVSSHVDKVSFDMDLDHDPGVKSVLEKVMQWFEHDALEGRALVLAGNPGCGKTHIARRISRASWGKFGGPKFVRGEASLVSEIRAAYSGDGSASAIIGHANGSGMLILDDVGVAYVKDLAWIQEIYWRLLDGRFRWGRPTLLTTNLKEKQFKERLGPRALDRLLQAMGGPGGIVDMFGIKSYRLRGFER